MVYWIWQRISFFDHGPSETSINDQVFEAALDYVQCNVFPAFPTESVAVFIWEFRFFGNSILLFLFYLLFQHFYCRGILLLYWKLEAFYHQYYLMQHFSVKESGDLFSHLVCFSVLLLYLPNTHQTLKEILSRFTTHLFYFLFVPIFTLTISGAFWSRYKKLLHKLPNSYSLTLITL